MVAKKIKIPEKATVAMLREIAKNNNVILEESVKTPKQTLTQTHEKQLLESSSDLKVVAKCQSDRIFLVVKHDEESIDKLTCADGAYISMKDVCKNFAFEKSTGSSNVENFRNAFLPTLSRKYNGWIRKDGFFDRSGGLFVTDVLMEVMRNQKHTNECMKESLYFIITFLERFGCWTQLQISAALSKPEEDSVWTKIPVAVYLREIALNYDWVSSRVGRLDEKIFGSKDAKALVLKNVSDQKEKLKQQKVHRTGKNPDDVLISFLKEMGLNGTKTAHGIKLGFLSRKIHDEHDKPLKRESILSDMDNGFLIKRHQPIQPIDYTLDNLDQIPPRFLNDWLKKHSVYCFDDIKEAESKGRNFDGITTVIKDIPTTTDDIVGLFSGWDITI